MGGKGSGGRRAGAGRKKKADVLRFIDGGADRRGPAPADEAAGAAIAESPMVEPPAILTPAERAIWDQLAPQAHQAQTLAPSTVWAFVRLCQAEADLDELRQRYQPQRSATGEPRPLLYLTHKEEMALRRQVTTLWGQIRAAEKDFKVAPFGKEILVGGELPEADPLAAFMHRKRG